MERSESIKNIAASLCEFQKKVGKIKKGSSNPFFKSKYATLSEILDVIQEPLSENGLTIVQLPINENELETIIMHTSGEFISSSYTMKPTKNDPQGIGSCITYQRRYALGAALSLNIDEDDDGNKACGKSSNNKPESTEENRKIYTKETLQKPGFLDKIYKSEIEEKKNNKNFSLRRFIDKYYIINDALFNDLANAYIHYKTNNNLQ